MVSFKFALSAVATVLWCGCTSTSGAGESSASACMIALSATCTRAVLIYHVCLLLVAGEGQCTSGFLDLDGVSTSEIVTLPDSSLPRPNMNDIILLSDFRRWIFPNINFTCDGHITSWTLRVNNSMPESMDTALIPQITTWRLLPQSNNFYRQQSITNESQLTSLKIDTRLMFTPSPPIPVKAGDIIGIRLPTVNNDMLMIKPLFLNLSEGNSSTISCAGLQGNSNNFAFENRICSTNGGDEEQSLYIPLISVNISKLPHRICTQVTCIKTSFK